MKLIQHWYHLESLMASRLPSSSGFLSLDFGFLAVAVATIGWYGLEFFPGSTIRFFSETRVFCA